MALFEIVGTVPLEVQPYGLLSLRDPAVTDDERWLSGFTYESLECTAEINLLDVCNGTAPVNVVQPADDPRNREYMPFGIEAVDRCSTFGFTQHDVEERALTALQAGTQKVLETELWTGGQAQAQGLTSNRYLASSDTTDVTPGGVPVKVRYGLALLEQAMSDCSLGTRGTIHVTTEVGSVIPLTVVDRHLETQIGNYVVVGSGYTGIGPDGSMPAKGAWMYATGPVTVRLGPASTIGVRQKQQIKTDTNLWEARAQRGAAVFWRGCCTFAVNVDLTLDYM